MNVILSIQIANYHIVQDQHKYTVSEHNENNECDFINTKIMKIMNLILSMQIANYHIVQDQHKVTVSEHTDYKYNKYCLSK